MRRTVLKLAKLKGAAVLIMLGDRQFAALNA